MNKNTNVTCPVYFENHEFGGVITEIENLINYDIGINIRTTFINGAPYFSANDVCKGLALNSSNTGVFVNQAVNDILQSDYIQIQNSSNIQNMTPLTKIGGSDYTENLYNFYNSFESNLYFYLDIEIDHTNQYGKKYTQIVNTLFISEPVLYVLMFRSRKREAINFKVWLSVEVLPKMRYIGRERFIKSLNNETATKIAEDIHNINENFNKIMNIDNKSEEKILQNINDIRYRIDNIGFMASSLSNTQQMMISQQYQTDNKVTAIASGLNTIFGK